MKVKIKRRNMNKESFDETQKGLIIDNIPSKSGTLTGNYDINYCGCWWEVQENNDKYFWMIGEYPEKYKR